jgi:hypothetical protein
MGHEVNQTFEERLTAAAFLKGATHGPTGSQETRTAGCLRKYVYDMNAKFPMWAASLFWDPNSHKQYVLMKFGKCLPAEIGRDAAETN